MKNKMLKGIALGVITALVIACQPKKEEAAAPVAIPFNILFFIN